MKTVILKNNTTEQIILEDLGLRIDVGEDVYIDDNALELENSTNLISAINDETIIVNDGTNDLSIQEALDYISISVDLSDYYNKVEVDGLLNNKAPIVHDHDNLYYTKLEIDNTISGIESYGIRGAVNTIDDLPTTGSDGEIYIVRGTSGDGVNDKQYVVNDDSILYTPFNDTFDDEIGNLMTHSTEYNFVTGRNGNALQLLSGVETWGKYQSSVKSFNPEQISGGLWIYVDEDSTLDYETYNPLIHFWDEYRRDGFYLLLDRGRVKFWIGTDRDNRDPKTRIQVPVRKWTHIGFSYSSITKRVRVLINGIIYAEETAWCGGNIVAQDYLYIGYNPQQNHGVENNILIDEFFLQEGELTENDFQNIINGAPYTTIKDEGFYQWQTDHWEWLANNTTSTNSGVTYISSTNAEDLTDGGTTDLHNHDDRYYQQGELFTQDELNNGQLDNRYYTKTELNNGQLDSRYYTESEIDNKINNIKFSDISSNDSSTNITGAELEQLTDGSNCDGLHTHSNLGGGGGLDEAYDIQSTFSHGGGRQIAVDAGPVQLNASNGFAPLKLTEIDYTPNQWLGGGELCIKDGELFLYDATRSKWLSVSGYTIGGGYNSNNIKARYLKMFNGTSMNSHIGWCAPWDGVIVAMSIVSDHNNCSNSIVVRKNGVNTDARVYYENNYHNSVDNLNVSFVKGDVLSFYMDGYDDYANRPQTWVIVKRTI